MRRRPTRAKRTATLIPDTTHFRSRRVGPQPHQCPVSDDDLPGGRAGGQRLWLSEPAAHLWRNHPLQILIEGAGRQKLGRSGTGKKRNPGLSRERPGFLFCLCRSEEHTSELQSLMRISYAVFCLKQKNTST